MVGPGLVGLVDHSLPGKDLPGESVSNGIAGLEWKAKRPLDYIENGAGDEDNEQDACPILSPKRLRE